MGIKPEDFKKRSLRDAASDFIKYSISEPIVDSPLGVKVNKGDGLKVFLYDHFRDTEMLELSKDQLEQRAFLEGREVTEDEILANSILTMHRRGDSITAPNDRALLDKALANQPKESDRPLVKAYEAIERLAQGIKPTEDDISTLIKAKDFLNTYQQFNEGSVKFWGNSRIVSDIAALQAGLTSGEITREDKEGLYNDLKREAEGYFADPDKPTNTPIMGEVDIESARLGVGNPFFAKVYALGDEALDKPGAREETEARYERMRKQYEWELGILNDTVGMLDEITGLAKQEIGRGGRG